MLFFLNEIEISGVLVKRNFIMATQDNSYDRQLPAAGNDDKRKKRVILYTVIFAIGIVAGVIGLCSALKFIFYVGLFVTIAAAVGIVVGIIVAKNKIQDAADRRKRNNADYDADND